MPPLRSLLRLTLLLATLAFAGIIASPAESAGGGNTFIVDTNSPANLSTCAPATAADCSLSGAITKTNLGQGNTISFDLPSCPGTPSACVIEPGSALPTITQMTTIINGTLQPGYTDTPIVVIDGSSAGNVDGLTITADNAVIWGLWIRDFEQSGINDYLANQINATFNYNHIEGNGSYGIGVGIGTSAGSELDMDGNTIINNGYTGVYAAYATMHKAVIQNNVITGNNGRGIDIAVSDDLTLTNNNISGNLNASEGVYAQSTTTDNVTFTSNHIENNTAGGVVVAAATLLDFSGNTISGNNGTGINAIAQTVTDIDLESNVISGNQGNGFAGYSSNSLTLHNNNITNNTDDGVDASGNTVTTATITDNDIGGNQANGLVLAVGTTLTLEDNTIHNNTLTGVISSSFTTSSVNVTHNNVLANGSGGLILSGTTNAIHFNRFANNVNSGLAKIAGSTLDATQNWWGCNEGPLMTGCDNAFNANYDPWLVLGIDADPNPVPTGGQSIIIGDVNHNPNGGDISSFGHLQDGIELLFATDIGNIDGSAQDAGPIHDGKATDVFNAPNNPGTAHVSVTLDNETVTLPVAVTSTATPTPTPSPTPSSSASPSPSPTHSPTATPFGSHTQGDTNCSGHIDGADGLPPLLHTAGVQLASVSGGCPNIGAGTPPFGDVNCDGVVDELDVIAILQYAAELLIDPPQPGGCTPLGAALP